MKQPVLEVRNVHKIYEAKQGRVAALEDINLTVYGSEFVSILGPSGCGKTTLLRCMAGLERHTSGDLWVDSIPIDGPPNNMGMVFQRDILLDWRTVIQNVLLPVEVYGLSRREWRPKASMLLNTLGLGRFEDSHVWELSGGMRQRVSICRALLLNPKLLLMDEPFGALDAMTRDELNVELQRIWMSDEKTVVFVTHSISEAVFLGDRVVIMSPHPGQIADIIDVDLPRPRDLEIRETPEFNSYTRRARLLFQQMDFSRETSKANQASQIGKTI